MVAAARRLRLVLVMNGIFSLMSGGWLLLRPSIVGVWLGVRAPLLLAGIGAGLVVFAADLFRQAATRRVRTWQALYATVMDFTWVVATIVLLVAFPGRLSHPGIALTLGVALVVLLLGVGQLGAIDAAHQMPGSRVYRHCLMVEVNVDPDAMWRIIGRLEDIQDFMPSLRRSILRPGHRPGVGAVRTCEDHGGRRWSEECTGWWDDRRAMTVRFLSEADDFPFPAEEMRGGWSVTPSGTGSQVMVWWELLPKRTYLAPVILPLLAFGVDRQFPEVIRRMATAAAGQSRGAEAPGGFEARTRLVPSVC